MERYEALCAAIGMIASAMELLSDYEDGDEVNGALANVRGDLDIERNKILGNGRKRPWTVCELMKSVDLDET